MPVTVWEKYRDPEDRPRTRITVQRATETRSGRGTAKTWEDVAGYYGEIARPRTSPAPRDEGTPGPVAMVERVLILRGFPDANVQEGDRIIDVDGGAVMWYVQGPPMRYAKTKAAPGDTQADLQSRAASG